MDNKKTKYEQLSQGGGGHIPGPLWFDHKKNLFFVYSPFNKTLPKSCLQMNQISVRFNEMGDIFPLNVAIIRFQKSDVSLYYE